MGITLTLGVTDLKRTLEFYREILQLEITEHRMRPHLPPLLLLQRGNTTVLFRDLSTLQALHPAIFEAVERHPRGLGMTLEFSVADLAAICRNISRRQLHTVYELVDDESGWQELWLHDPDGYLVILSHGPPPP